MFWDMQSGRKTFYGRIHEQYLVRWKGNNDPNWISEVDLNCVALLIEFKWYWVSRNRFEAINYHEVEIDN